MRNQNEILRKLKIERRVEVCAELNETVERLELFLLNIPYGLCILYTVDVDLSGRIEC